MERHLAAMFVKQRPPPFHVGILDLGEVLENGTTLDVAFDACERAVQPGGIHLVRVVLVPRGFNSHSSMLSRVGLVLAVRRPEHPE